MSNLEIGSRSESIRHRQRIKSVLLLFAVVAFGVLGLSGCGQTGSVPTEAVLQKEPTEAATETISKPEPTPESEIAPLPQPQADGTGISFALPDDWNKYQAGALQDL